MEGIDVTTLISNVGFPIFCVLALGFAAWKAFNMVMENNKERETKLYDTIAAVRAQLNASAETNASFVKVLESMAEDIDDIKTKLEHKE